MKISIVTPVYNASKYLRKTIGSVLGQDFLSYEWIICDDGSTDDSIDIIRSAANKNSHIHLIEQENKGVSSARNACLREVSGEYLIFLDADDSLSDNALKRLSDTMDESGADVCIYGWYFEKDCELEPYFFSDEEIQLDIEMLYKNIIVGPYVCGGGYPWNKIWRISSIRDGQIPAFNERLHHEEDKLWTLKRIDSLKNPKVKFLNEPLYRYYINNDSLSHFSDYAGFSKYAEYTIDSLNVILKYVQENHPSAINEAEEHMKSETGNIMSLMAYFAGLMRE